MKKATKKITTKKSAAKKTTARKATAKKTVPAKKAAAKKPTAKKTVVKKTTKTATKKAAAKSKPVAKTAVKKTAPKKAAAKPASTRKTGSTKTKVKKITTPPTKKTKIKAAITSSAAQSSNEGVGRTRYSDAELQEFKELILEKMDAAKRELAILTSTLSNPNENGTDDTAGTFKVLEDGSATLEKEHISQMASRQRKFIDNLEAALVRIENKTYGICRETGRLIPKERLRAVPHTTLSMEAKLRQN